jgi:hypothetical protein
MNVYPYSDKYEAAKNVPIVKGATTVQDPRTGEVVIMTINEGFVNKLNHFLINPNQLRYYGVTEHDNPFGKEEICIDHIKSEITVPPQTQGTIVIAYSIVPTNQELQTFRYIEVISPIPWNPSTVTSSALVCRLTHIMISMLTKPMN